MEEFLKSQIEYYKNEANKNRKKANMWLVFIIIAFLLLFIQLN